MPQRSKRAGWKHSSGVYRRFALIHFAYALVLTIPAALMLVALDFEFATAALLFAEFLAFLLVPYVGWVRQSIDARLDERAHAEAASGRAILLMRMSEEHRRELHTLEKIASSLRERGAAVDPNGELLGLDRLIELYVRLAIAHRASRSSLEIVGRARLDDEISALEACLVAGRPVNACIEKRLEIARMRRNARRAALNEQARLDHELALIGHTLRWMEEHCASTGSETLRTDLASALESRDRDASTLRELAELRDADYDASVVRTGRDYPSQEHFEPLVRIGTSTAALVEADEHHGRIGAEREALLVRL
jgi:hypothetical protein